LHIYSETKTKFEFEKFKVKYKCKLEIEIGRSKKETEKKTVEAIGRPATASPSALVQRAPPLLCWPTLEVSSNTRAAHRLAGVFKEFFGR
jgi:hypothetical protein